MTRTTRRLAAAGLAVLLLAGCGGAANRSGAAATVGDARITAADLEAIVTRGLQDPAAQQEFGSDRADYQRQVLNRLVRSLLLEAAVQEEGLEVTQGDVDAQFAEFVEQAGSREAVEAQAAAGGIHPDDIPLFAREVALDVALGDALTEDLDVPEEQLQELYDQNIAQFDRVGTRHILVEDETLARELLAQVQADRESFEELAAANSIDESNAQDGGDLGLAGRGQFVTEFEDAAFGAAVGDVVLVQTQFGWHVVEVLDRQTTTLAQARDDLRRQVLGQQGQQLVNDRLRETGERLGVDVNPRFGRWDPESVQVAPVPDDDGLSKPAPERGDPGTGGQQPGQPGQPRPGQPQPDQPGAPEGGELLPEGEPVPAPQ